MSRPRAFDEQDVLTAAMHAFRRQGYAGISVADLETATGLRTSSLYNAFGDKAGLFGRALDHYVTSFVAPRLATHAGAGATLDDLEELFLSLFRPPLDDGYGCLVVNSAAEFGSGESIARDGVRRGLDLVQHHLEGVLRREVGVGAASAAARLALVYQGLLGLSRAGLLTTAHRNAIHDDFDALRRKKETHMRKTGLNPASVPASPFYSQGMEVPASSRLVFVAGQVGVDSDGTPLDGIEAQATRAISNLSAVLGEAGLSPADLVKLTIYLTDPADVPAFIAATGGTLPEPPPATTLLIVSGLADPALRVEIEGIAAG